MTSWEDCFKHWKYDFSDQSLSILILNAQLLVSFSQIQQCVKFWVLFNSHRLWHLFVFEVTKERWNLNCLFWKRSSSEAQRHHPLRPGGKIRAGQVLGTAQSSRVSCETKTPDSSSVMGTASDNYFFFVSISVEIRMWNVFG